MSLPIESVLPTLLSALQTGPAAVLQAPPGAGKTTGVPPALLNAPWLAGRRIVLLEPRRLAARAAATRMAWMIGQEVGRTVGYRIRLETRVSAETRIEVVTEGVLTRMLQSDPGLEGVGLVIFDEFHERSLHADLGLALCLESQAVLRTDLRLLVMSATLEGSRVAALLGDAPVVTSEGKAYPVETRYLHHVPDEPVDWLAARAVRRALEEVDGDLLVFLPGGGEIRRTADRLRAGACPENVDVSPLYGDLPLADQDRAIAPSPAGRRKVVLATDIAETSLTIEGVRAVIDTGWRRGARFDPGSGMTRLVTVRISRDSADQRRGRAGRTSPGTCYRLWTRHTHQHLTAHSGAEILDADLAPLALELALWGTRSPASLQWLDPPPPATFAQAQDLLRGLGALDPEGRITAHGRQMAAVPAHPRLAHMILTAKPLGLQPTACDLAALLSERDIFRSSTDQPSTDIRLRLEVLRSMTKNRKEAIGSWHGSLVDQRTLRHVHTVSMHLRRRFGAKGSAQVESTGLLLAMAYPDRIGQRKEDRPGSYRLSSGRAARLRPADPLAGESFIVAAQLDGQRQGSAVFLAAPVSQGDLETSFCDSIERAEEIVWDAAAQRVAARRVETLGALVLREAPLTGPDASAVLAAFMTGIRSAGLGALPWTKDAHRLLDRMRFVSLHEPAFPDLSDQALLDGLDTWLAPHLVGMRRLGDLQQLDLARLLLSLLTRQQLGLLDALAPSHLLVPSGSRIPIDYSDPQNPVLAVRLQEVFGMMDTPRIAGGRIPVTVQLLSPAHRPVQVTRDLASFWEKSYFEVRKELRGRYPKHYWPENPREATPTSRTKPRR